MVSGAIANQVVVPLRRLSDGSFEVCLVNILLVVEQANIICEMRDRSALKRFSINVTF